MKLFGLWKFWAIGENDNDNTGFTLIELLIAIAISGLVVSSLLYLVTELLRIDNRETALEEVQRDAQRAINYIAADLREAVYVYTTPGDFATPLTTADTIANSTTGVGAALPAGSIPILAFWKVSPVDNIPSDCTPFTDPDKLNACQALNIRRSSYDLVVYSQLPGPAEPWKGQSRISRYVLEQYENVTTLDETSGYVDPTLLDNEFNAWQTTSSLLPTSPAGSAVLVDYIGSIGSSGTAVDCQTLIPGSNGEYTESPVGVPEDSSFFACIRDTDTDVVQQDGQRVRSNQDVYVFLRADVSARATSVAPASEASRSPILQTQVLVRGVINKDLAD